MLDSTWEPSRRDILRTDAYRSTPYGKECSERNIEQAHEYLEKRLQRGDVIKLTPEDAAVHEEWRKKHYKPQPRKRWP